jgi:hypothetical protein
LSSWKPGASPTNMRSALASPTPNTTCVRPCESRQRVHADTSSAKAPRAAVLATASVSAATAPAATTASGRSAEARLLGGAVSREHGELAARLRRAAFRAVRVSVVEPDELLEVLLARHARVLVDRHRRGSVGTSPDASQIRQRLPRPPHPYELRVSRQLVSLFVEDH